MAYVNGHKRKHKYDHVCNQTMSTKEVPEILRNPESWSADCWILPDFHLSSILTKMGHEFAVEDGKERIQMPVMVGKTEACPQNSNLVAPWANTAPTVCEVHRKVISKSSPCTVLQTEERLSEEEREKEFGSIYRIGGETAFKISINFARKRSLPWFPKPSLSVIPYNDNIQHLSNELFHRVRGETPVFRTVCFHIRGGDKPHLAGATDLFISWASSQAHGEGDEDTDSRNIELRHGHKRYKVDSSQPMLAAKISKSSMTHLME